MQPVSDKRPLEVTIIGWLFILSSLVHMQTLALHYFWYRDLYAFMPEWLIVLRYSFSWLQRIVGITAAIGFLAGNEIARKIILAIEIFTILTVYWKHPYEAVVDHCQKLDILYGSVLSTLTNGQYTFFALAEEGTIALVLSDVVFSLGVIYFITRPHVRRFFR